MATTTLVKTLPEKILQWIPLPYWLSIILFWSLEPIFDYVYLARFPVAEDFVGAHLGIMLFFASISITLVYSSRVMSKLLPDLLMIVPQDPTIFTTWYQARLKKALSGIGPIISGVLFVLAWELTMSGIVKSSVTDNDVVLQVLWKGYLIIGFFFLGYGVWALLHVALIPHELLKFNPKVSLNQVSGIGLQSIGAAYFKIALGIAASFLILIITVVLSPLSGRPEILAWQGVGAMLIFSFFIFPQFGVHKIMAAEKKRSLIMLAEPLDTAIRQSLKDPTTENTNRLKELIDLQASIRGMNDWPFNINTMWQLVTALMIPLILAVLEIVY